MKPHILLIDDSETIHGAISNVLPKREYTLTPVSSGHEGLLYMEQHPCDLILLDYSLPDTDGMELLQKIVKKYPNIPVIMITGSGSERLAVNALKSGASDYLVKSQDFISKIPHTIRENLDKYEMKRRNRELENQLRESFKQQKQLNRELEEKVLERTEELERAYQLSNELMAKAVDSNMQLAELYTEVDEARRRLDAKIRELSLLNNIGKQIALASDQDELLQMTLDAVHEELGIEHCAILLINEETHRLQIGVSYGTPDDLLLAATTLNGERILWEVIKRDEPLLVQDIEFDERCSALMQDYPGIECFIVVPMRIKRHEIGIFTIYGYEYNATFTKDDVDFVSSLASQASIALANLRMMTHRIHHEQMNMLADITMCLTDILKPSYLMLQEHAEHLVHKELSPKEHPSVLQQLKENMEQGIEIIQELQEFSQGKRGILDRQTLSVQEFVEEVVEHLTPYFTNQQIHIHQKLDYSGNFTADRKKMIRVFLHIAEYVRHVMPNGGNFTIASHLADNSVHFEFSDDVSSITPEYRERLFASFTSEKEQSFIDLRMACVKKIIDEHGAHIDVQYIGNKGTTFHLSLPQSE